MTSPDPAIRKHGKKRTRILVNYTDPQPFADRDVEILDRHFSVQSFQFNGLRSVPRLSVSVAKCDVTYSWFVMGNATSAVSLSQLMRKKSLVVAGGWDVFYLPEIDYGAMKSKKRRRRTAYALKHANRVLAVSESTKKEVLQWVKRDVDVVYNAIDTNRFIPGGEKTNLVITVAGVSNLTRLKKKGLETLLEVAARMPDTQFAIIGGNSPEWDKRLREMAPSNVKIAGRISDDELLSYFQAAKVYAQISYHESFGVSLAEGMACGCIPVVTNRSALPEVVGDTGFYVDYGDVEGIVEATSKALESENGEKCRKRVHERFSLEIREKELLRIIEEVAGS